VLLNATLLVSPQGLDECIIIIIIIIIIIVVVVIVVIECRDWV